MPFVIISAAVALFTLISASPTGVKHEDCEYSGVIGNAWAQGTCIRGGQYGSGICIIPGMGKAECDYQFHNDAGQSPCYNAYDSQYSCKQDGQPCWAFWYAGNQDLAVLHCGVA